eukprot:437511_1
MHQFLMFLIIIVLQTRKATRHSKPIRQCLSTNMAGKYSNTTVGLCFTAFVINITFLLLLVYCKLITTPNYTDYFKHQHYKVTDIIVANEIYNIISNKTLFKYNHQNDTIKYCANFSVIYLVEGYSIFETNDWYSLMYENDNNYMIFLYYNKESYFKDYNRLITLLNRTNSHKLKLLIICGFNTSQNVGQNIMLSYMFQYEKIMLNDCNFNYITFVDQDINLYGFNETNNDIIPLNNIYDYNIILNDFYSNFLLKYNPIIGIPHRIDYDHAYQSWPKIPKQYLGYKYLKVQYFDPMIGYYSRPLLNNNFLFPLYDKYDDICWWWCAMIEQVKLRMLFPFDKYNISIMYMKMAVTNSQHGEYPKHCGDPYGNWYTKISQFSQWMQKCNINVWGKNIIKLDGIWLKEISLQKYNYTKNNPKYYFDEFIACG